MKKNDTKNSEHIPRNMHNKSVAHHMLNNNRWGAVNNP